MTRVSADLYVIPLSAGTHLIYAPLRLAAFVANTSAVNFIARLREGVVEYVEYPSGEFAEFLRRLEILDAGPEPRPVSAFRGEPRPTTVTLFLTTACNLRCSYCYASSGDTPAKSMKLDVARRGIDFVAGNAVILGESSFEVAYHGGGEPAVNFAVMKDSMDYAREKACALGLEVNATAATNGVLTEEQTRWFIGNLEGASVSIDGLPEVHDKHRLTALGEGSSGRVIETLYGFDSAGFPYGLRVTVTADQIRRLPASIDFLASRFNAQQIQVEPAFRLGRWREAPSAETEEFIQAFREAAGIAKSHGVEIGYSAARLGTLTNHFCNVTQDLFALSPDGNVSSCYEVFSEENRWAGRFFYGRPDENGGYCFDLDVLDHLRRQTVENREFCRGCFARWSCAGDCYHKSLAAEGVPEFSGTERCHITRELTKDQILARIAASGGVFWHEPPPGRSFGEEEAQSC